MSSEHDMYTVEQYRNNIISVKYDEGAALFLFGLNCVDTTYIA